LPGANQIPAVGEMLHSEIHEFIKLIWNKGELPYLWKESTVTPIHKKGDKTYCSNYWGIALLSSSYKILYTILVCRLIPYANEIIGHHQFGFTCNRSVTDKIFYIHQILEKKWEYNGTVHQQFIDFKKPYDSVRRQVLYNILSELRILGKLVGLNNMCLNETYSAVRIIKYLSDMFPVQKGLKQRDALLRYHWFLTLLWNMPLGGSMRTRKDWNWMGHISFWPMLVMLI
jgi:hypothetical protein